MRKISATTFTSRFRKTTSPLKTLSRKKPKIKAGVRRVLRGKGGVIKTARQTMGVPGGFSNARTGAFR